MLQLSIPLFGAPFPLTIECTTCRKEDDHYIKTCISLRKVTICGIPESRALQRQHDENAVEDVDEHSNIIAVNESHMS